MSANSIAVVAFGAVSSLGEGSAAVSAGEVGDVARGAISRDEELARAGLARPFVARVPLGPGEDRATALLERALRSCALDLDRTRPAWRAERIGLIVGTSSGGMRAAETAFAAIARGGAVSDVEGATYYGPMARAARCLRVPLDPSILVLGACASSTIAVGVAMRWLVRGGCDLVLAGGYDEVTVFVAAGFEALRAITASPPPRPFRVGRDGMALGEGAAVVALARSDSPVARVFITGFGAASDAVHLTAPDRAGAGLARAAVAALREAGRPGIDLVGAHGTATPFNDAAESRAIAHALGADCSREVVVHPFKAQIGHTLGAAGVLELLACADAIERGVMPASAGAGPVDGDAPAHLLERTHAGAPRSVLKLSAAFGGSNAALVVTSRPEVSLPVRPRRPAFVCHATHVDHEPALEDLAAASGLSIDRLARGDALVRMALAALARLQGAVGALAGAGIIVGTALATLETNAAFAARIRERGAAAAEPRRFPYTSPNAVAGECSIAFGLTGPSFSVGGGMHAAIEALAIGAVMVESRDANRIVVVAVDDVGPATAVLAPDALRPGAIAVLLSADAADGARARVGAITLRRGEASKGAGAAGHLALQPLVRRTLPREVVCASPGILARVAFDPV